MIRTPCAVCIAALALVSVALPGAATAYEPQLTRYPYLTDVVGSTAHGQLGHRPLAHERAREVRRGRRGVLHRAHADRVEDQHHGQRGRAVPVARAAPGSAARRSLLLPGRVRDRHAGDRPAGRRSVAHVPQRRLPAGSAEPFSFAVLGDWGAAGDAEAGADNRQADVMTQLAQSGVRFAVGTGDTAYPSGTQTNYGDLRQTGTNVSGVFAPQHWKKVGASIPFFNATGNHGFNSTFLSIWPQPAAASSSSGRYADGDVLLRQRDELGELPECVVRVRRRQRALLRAGGGVERARTTARRTSTRTITTRTGRRRAPSTSGSRTTCRPTPRSSSSRSSISRCTRRTRPSCRTPGCAERTASRACSPATGWTSGSAVTRTTTRAMSSRDDGSLVTYVTGGGGARLQPATRCGAPVAYAVGWSYTIGGSSCGGAARPTSIDQVFHFLKVSVDGSRVTVAPTDSQGRTFDVQTYDFPARRLHPRRRRASRW